MNFLLDLYLHLKIRTRIFFLCLCYSMCIIFAVVAGRVLSPTVSILSTAVFVLLGALFSGLLFWSVNDALNRIIGFLSLMTEGDLTQKISAKRNNEISSIIRSISTLQTNMRDIIGQISFTSQKMAQASGNLYTNATQIASGTEEVALQTNSVATASQEMAATSNDIAHNCMSAAETSNRASDTARSGAEIVKRATNGMERIAVRVKDT
ncbi:MAG: methyl-accepting chemotaxis protein, partial [Pelobacteraceae bacterium]